LVLAFHGDYVDLCAAGFEADGLRYPAALGAPAQIYL
jgi:hypothetical protein